MWITLCSFLTHNYIVPWHFSQLQDVTEAVTNGRMTKEIFLSEVASNVFQIKGKLPPEDMINVSQAIIALCVCVSVNAITNILKV